MRQRMDGAGLVVGVLVLSLISGCLCPPKGRHQTGEIPVPPSEEPVAVTPTPPAPPEPPPLPPPLPPTPEPPKKETRPTPPSIAKEDPNTGTLTFDSDVLFDSGSTVVKPRAKAALEDYARSLTEKQYRHLRLQVVGHTDSDRVVKASTIDNLKKLGKSADNMGLSEARAEAVAAVLQGGGVDSSRMTTKGKGATEPLSDNKTADGKARNRRVEVHISN